MIRTKTTSPKHATILFKSETTTQTTKTIAPAIETVLFYQQQLALLSLYKSFMSR